MTASRVYKSITAIATELTLTGVAKRGRNIDEGYSYRSIDDVVAALAPLLAKQKLCMFPRISERSYSQQRNDLNQILHAVSVRGTFEFVSAVDGSRHSVETFGEALDASDKATNKAMTAAYKYALVQTFCIPVSGLDDADQASPHSGADHSVPVQGWEAWACDIVDLVRGCESADAVDRVQKTYGSQLRTLSLTSRKDFLAIGSEMAARRQTLRGPAPGVAPAMAAGRKKETKVTDVSTGGERAAETT